jgi:hypothetical protein
MAAEDEATEIVLHDVEAPTELPERSPSRQSGHSHSVTFKLDPLQPPKHSGSSRSLRCHSLHQSMPPGTMFADLKDDLVEADDFENGDGSDGAETFKKKAHWACRSSGRPDHVHALIAKTRASMKFIESQNNTPFLSQNSSMQSFQDVDIDTKKPKTEEEEKDADGEYVLRIMSGRDFSFDIDELLDSSAKESLMKESEYIHRILQAHNKLQKAAPRRGRQIEVRLKDFHFVVPTQTKEDSFVATVWNQSVFFAVIEFFRRVDRVVKYKRKKRQRQSQALSNNNGSYNDADTEEINELDQSERGHRRLFPKSYRKVLDNISICLKPGKMYLVLGSPGSGKTSFLKAIAGLLPHTDASRRVEHGIRSAKPYTEGTCQYNGLTMKVGELISGCCVPFSIFLTHDALFCFT